LLTIGIGNNSNSQNTFLQGDLLLVKENSWSSAIEYRLFNSTNRKGSVLYHMFSEFDKKWVKDNMIESCELKYEGIKRELDRQEWLLKERIREIDYIIEQCRVPKVLDLFKINIIRVIEISSDNNSGLVKIQFVHAYDYQSYAMFLPKSFDLESGHFQLKMKNGNIIGIDKTSRLVSENFSRVRSNCFPIFRACLKGLIT